METSNKKKQLKFQKSSSSANLTNSESFAVFSNLSSNHSALANNSKNFENTKLSKKLSQLDLVKKKISNSDFNSHNDHEFLSDKTLLQT